MAESAALRGIGLNDAILAPLAKNPKLAAKLEEVVKAAGFESTGCDATTGNLLYYVASKLKDSLAAHRPFLGRAVGAGHLRLNAQVSSGSSCLQHACSCD
jgi:hypothetical protein